MLPNGISDILHQHNQRMKTKNRIPITSFYEKRHNLNLISRIIINMLQI